MFRSIVVENSLHLLQASALEDVLQVPMPDSHALETCPCRSYHAVLKIKRTVLFVRMRLRPTRNRPVRSQQLHVLRHAHPHIQDFSCCFGSVQCAVAAPLPRNAVTAARNSSVFSIGGTCPHFSELTSFAPAIQIGRASCKGKSVDLGGRRIIKKKKKKKKSEA